MGVATQENESYLICWDVQQKTSMPRTAFGSTTTHSLLRPVAHMLLGSGLAVERYGYSWAQIQGHPELDGVIIALRASNVDTGVRYKLKVSGSTLG